MSEKTIDIEARFSKEDFRYDGRKEEEISSRGNIFPTRQKMGKEEEKSGKKWSNKAWPNNKYLRREENGSRRFLEAANDPSNVLRPRVRMRASTRFLHGFALFRELSSLLPRRAVDRPFFSTGEMRSLSAREIDAASFAQISDKWRTKEGRIAVLIVNDDGTEFGGGPRAVPLRLTIRR